MGQSATEKLMADGRLTTEGTEHTEIATTYDRPPFSVSSVVHVKRPTTVVDSVTIVGNYLVAIWPETLQHTP